MSVAFDKFVKRLSASRLMTVGALQTLLDELPKDKRPNDGETLAKWLVKEGHLTPHQAKEVYRGKTKGLVLGNYVILDKIGAGGMGQVFKAEHRRMKRTVALKVLQEDVANDPSLVARFQREAQAAAKLMHPNIVTAFDADEEDGIIFLVMEYVPGRDLASIVKKQGPLPVDQAVQCILDTARGLEYAHAHGVIHRDIKPANLLLSSNADTPAVQSTRSASITGTTKILDMGLARIEDTSVDAATQAELTGTGMVMGTVDYMSPEQALNTKNADHRSDIYSLGITLYYLLTGKPTYPGDSVMERLIGHRESHIPSLTTVRDTVPKALDDLFARMIAKNPDERIPTMTAVIQTLEDLQAGPTAKPPGDETQIAPADMGDTALASFFNAMGSDEATQPEVSSGPTQVAVTPTEATEADAGIAETIISQVEDPTATVISSGVSHQSDRRRQSRGGHGRNTIPRGWGLWGGLAALLLLGAGIVITLTTDKGTVTIELADGVGDDVAIELTGGGAVHIADKANNWSIDVAEGEYKVNVQGGADQFALSKQQIVVKRKQTELLRVTLKPPDAASNMASGGLERDRSAAQFVLSVGGSVVVRTHEGRLLKLSDADRLPEDPFALVLILLYQKSDPPLSDEHIRGLKQLTNFSVRSPEMTDAGLAHLAENVNLQYIMLDEAPVTGAGLASIERLPQLYAIKLINCPNIDTAALKSIGRMAGLTELALHGAQQVTDASISPLKALTKLHTLDVEQTGITADGIETLHTALPGCTIISDFGTFGPPDDREIAEWLISEKGMILHVIDAAGQDYNGVRELPEGSISVKGVYSYENESLSGRFTSAELSRLGDLKQLLTLSLQQTEVTPEQLGKIGDLSQLAYLNLVTFQTSTVTDDNMAAMIEKLPRLVSVRTTNFRLTGEFLQAIQDPDLLKYLGVSQSDGLTNPGMTPIISEETIHRLERFPNLTLLDLSGPTHNSAHYNAIAALTSIEHLRLNHDKGVPQSLADLQTLPRLQSLHVAWTPLDDSQVDALAKITTLKSLNLAKTNITKAGVKRLYKALPGCTIESDFGTFGPPDERVIAEWLLLKGWKLAVTDESGKLTEGIGEPNELPSGTLIVGGASKFGWHDVPVDELARLSKLSRLTYFGAHLQRITPEHLTEIASHKALDNVNLASRQPTAITDDDMAAFVAQLPNLWSMRTFGFKLAGTYLQHIEQPELLTYLVMDQVDRSSPDAAIPEVSVEVLQDLQRFPNLASLRLSAKDFGEDHFRAISEKESINSLFLSGASSIRSGLPHLAALPNLKDLTLASPDLGDDDVEALSRFTQLKDLDVGGTTLTKAGIDRLHKALPNCKIESAFGTFGPSAETTGLPSSAVAPFDAEQAKQHQQAWAKSLGVPVEKDVDLGGGVKMTMVLIPPGEFMMGSGEKEQARFVEEPQAAGDQWTVDLIASEGPQHRVQITRPFRLSRHEVTRGQFRQFVKETEYKTDAEQNGKGGRGFLDGQAVHDPRFVWNSDLGLMQTDDHPVLNVSWNDATAFCQWLTDQPGSGRYQLPTEAQWEYTCRAGTTTIWQSGDDEAALEEYAWFGAESGQQTCSVGLLKPNAWNLSGMHGNAMEWCADWYAKDYYSRSPVSDPTGPLKSSSRVHRGGCWGFPGSRCRSAVRIFQSPDLCGYNVGFRVAMVIDVDRPQAAPVRGSALTFDGVDDYVEIPSLKLDDFPESQPITIEATLTFDAAQDIEAARVSNPVNWMGPNWIALFTKGGNFGAGRLTIDGSLLVEAPLGEPRDQPRRVAAVWDGATWVNADE